MKQMLTLLCVSLLTVSVHASLFEFKKTETVKMELSKDVMSVAADHVVTFYQSNQFVLSFIDVIDGAEIVKPLTLNVLGDNFIVSRFNNKSRHRINGNRYCSRLNFKNDKILDLPQKYRYKA